MSTKFFKISLKKILFISVLMLLVLLTILVLQLDLFTAYASTSYKLTLTPGMVTNENSSTGDPAMLADEQALAGDPPTGECTTNWYPVYSYDYPANCYIDLGQNYVITKICLYDLSGKDNFTVSSGSPGSWTQLFVENCDKYKVWKEHTVNNVNTRYIRFTKQWYGSNVSEIVVYGYPAGGATPTATPTVTPIPTPTPTPTPTPGTTPYKLNLTTDMVINEVLSGDAGLLVDEQAITGDLPVNPVSTNWAVGPTNATWYLPANAIIDLGRMYTISQIYLYDSSGAADVTFSYGEPFNWTTLFVCPMNQYNKWRFYPETGSFNIQTRYIQISKSTNVGLNEIVIYGYPSGPAPAPTPTVIPTDFNITVDQAVGVNFFIDDPVDKIAVGGFNREYHNWRWDEAVQNEAKWEPSYAGTPWNFDTFYTSLKNNNIGVFPCIKESVDWITVNRKHKPVSAGEDATNPASYSEHASHMFQYAARYGSTTVADSLLLLASGQPRNSGMDLIEYYEDWNEQNKTWEGREGYFNPYEYAAMASASYDGHCSAMGTNYGFINADPNAKFVMGGIDGVLVDYIDLMRLWFEWNRPDGKFAPDVVNVHTYCRDGSKGLSPEDGGLADKLEALVQYCDKYLPDKEIWLSEFGWDTNPSSPQRAPSLDVQGWWLVRAYVIAFGAGVDRAQMYMLRDVNPHSGTKYSSSGLVGPKGDWTPKPSWYHVYTLKNRLTGMKFTGKQPSGNPNVWIYKFKSITSNNGAYVIWCPTSNGTAVNNYQLSLSPNAATATLITLQNGDTDGVPSSLTISGSKVEVNVSEGPKFVLVDYID